MLIASTNADVPSARVAKVEESVKRLLIGAVVTLVFCLVTGGAAKADDIHLCATAAACTGNAGSVQFVSGGATTAFVYGKVTSPTPDTLFIIALTPVANNLGSWNSGTSLWQVLGESPTQTYPSLNAAICNLEGGPGCGTPTGFSAQSFNVLESSGITFSGAADTNPLSFTLPGTPSAGTIYMGFLEDAKGNLVAVSPWSSSLLNVPEPSSLVLLGVGLLALVGFAGRKLITA